jgi:hypothetical protein
MAAYFPRGQQKFTDTKAKLVTDYAGVAKHGANGLAFFCNQEVTLSERTSLAEAVEGPVEIYHLDRVLNVLLRAGMEGVRRQFLDVDERAAVSALPPRTFSEVMNPMGGPLSTFPRSSLYNGMLLMTVAALPVVPIHRHPAASDPRALLAEAGSAAQQLAARWSFSSEAARELSGDWKSIKHGNGWAAGTRIGMSDAASLLSTPSAYAELKLREGVGAVLERTWPTDIADDAGRLAFRAAREPEVVAELATSLGAFASLLRDADQVDVAVHLSAAPRSLVSSWRAVAGNFFGEPEGMLGTIEGDVEGYHTDCIRIDGRELLDPLAVAQTLTSAWILQFREPEPFYEHLRTAAETSSLT